MLHDASSPTATTRVLLGSKNVVLEDVYMNTALRQDREREREEERERERERFTTSIQPAWVMRTGLCSCLSLLQQGNETMADRLLVLVPHEHTHAPRSILEQARNWALMSLK